MFFSMVGKMRSQKYKGIEGGKNENAQRTIFLCEWLEKRWFCRENNQILFLRQSMHQGNIILLKFRAIDRMCGIAGFFDASLQPSQAEELLSAMVDSTKHRGPDGSGKWNAHPLWLGHNRLSIIDLSESGAQPMQKAGLVITFNGEVYNYLEIRKELESSGVQFRSHSDTEVILEAYRKWGKDSVKKFVGMWALAIWDESSKTLFCSRDRFGIKPFNYIFKDGKFYFASEFRALKLSSVFSDELNMVQVSRGLQLGWTGCGEETYFSCIRQLLPAHNLELKNGQITISRYWDIDPDKHALGSFDEKKEAFRALFTNSLQLHTRSDVEVGGCLSGGLDSSAIASLSAKLFPDRTFRTFTIFYSGKDAVDERPFAREVANLYPQIKPHYLEPSDSDIHSEFESFANAQEIPPPGSSPFSQYFVMKLAASHKMKVLLDGQGSDEFLAGYHHSFFRIYAGWMRKFGFVKVLADLKRRKQMHGLSNKELSGIFLKSMVSAFQSETQISRLEFDRKLPKLIPGVTSAQAVDFPKFNEDGLRELSYNLLFHTTLPSLLHYEDRNSMHFSIESRVPFLDHRLVEFGFSLNETDKVRDSSTKYILRESLAGILPEPIRHRKDKKGFVTPGEVKWLSGPLKHLLDFDPSKISFLDAKIAKDVLQEYKAGNLRHANLVWRMATLNHWLNKK